VFAQGYVPQAGITVTQAYPAARNHQNMDGGRDGKMVDPYVTFVEKPDGSAWVGCDLQGRVFTLDHTGLVTTIAGATWDRAKLPLDYADLSVTDTQIAATQKFVATIATPGFGDLKSAIDLCYDYRNYNVLYVAMAITNFIAKIDLFAKSSRDDALCRTGWSHRVC
jgi:hypothetical protein